MGPNVSVSLCSSPSLSMALPPTNGIHSLPNETLLNVFLHATAGIFPNLLAHPIPNLALKTELERIANVPLLSLSRVCSRWHTLALETPTLWSHLEVHAITAGAVDKTIQLSASHLERSQNVPLLIRFKGETFDHPLHPRIFDLLAEEYQVNCEVRLRHCKPVIPLDFLAVAPSLNRIMVPAPLLHLDSFRTIRKQITDLSCIVMPLHDELHTILRLLPELPDGASFHFMFDLDPSILRRNWDPALSLPSITAPLKILGCRLFDSLTLPDLEVLDLRNEAYPRAMLSWAPVQHSTFLGLCDRSEGQLLEILSLLGALEELQVGDPPMNEETPVVTDSFLRALMGQRAMPRLAELVCLSWLAFTPEVFSDWVVSKLTTRVEAKIQVALHPTANTDDHIFLQSTVHMLLSQLAVDNHHFFYLLGHQIYPRNSV
ncbi:hypothetical protein FB45DRAFT_1111312 [Roridomyces roridus]|uniref:F-box domain-containing protein n=1 Tax=Roridomyces roridus TaxID=1738132 RepID=A0AAD7B9V8_9AGAR|nr:hypothetical protein FB45DRAFT_1111312 [Roridomyces roridus]